MYEATFSDIFVFLRSKFSIKLSAALRFKKICSTFDCFKNFLTVHIILPAKISRALITFACTNNLMIRSTSPVVKSLSCSLFQDRFHQRCGTECSSLIVNKDKTLGFSLFVARVCLFLKTFSLSSFCIFFILKMSILRHQRRTLNPKQTFHLLQRQSSSATLRKHRNKKKRKKMRKAMTITKKARAPSKQE